YTSFRVYSPLEKKATVEVGLMGRAAESSEEAVVPVGEVTLGEGKWKMARADLSALKPEEHEAIAHKAAADGYLTLIVKINRPEGASEDSEHLYFDAFGLGKSGA